MNNKTKVHLTDKELTALSIMYIIYGVPIPLVLSGGDDD